MVEYGSVVQNIIFAESSVLDVSLGSKYVSNYPEAFSVVIN